MARYTVLRLMIFFGFLCALWLLGLRSASQQWWLLGLSAFGSMVVSFFVLRGPRTEFSASIARRVDARASRAELAADESAEDAEDIADTPGPDTPRP
jgi:alpha/beta superfamily hydrolase